MIMETEKPLSNKEDSKEKNEDSLLNYACDDGDDVVYQFADDFPKVNISFTLSTAPDFYVKWRKILPPTAITEKTVHAIEVC